MRIAIVTLPLHTNYGGILQAYALQTVLEQLGHKVEHLQPRVEFPKLHPSWKMPLVYCKRTFSKFFCGEFKTPIFTHPHKWIRKYTDAFIAKYINNNFISKEAWNETNVFSYDAVVFGSDQVWRPRYAYPIERYFGSFLGDLSVKRVAYAASFGTGHNEYSVEQQSNCTKLLKDFTGVSVRENSAVGMCKSMFGVEAKHVLDPTLLLSKDEYIKLIQDTPKSKGNLAVYVLDESPEIADFIEGTARKLGLTPFRTNSKVEDYNAPIIERLQPPLEQWLRSFYDAELVITDSFHACVFSIIFGKPFICIGNKGRGSARFESLLSMFGLEDRLVVSFDDFEARKENLMKEIDYGRVYAILEKKRQESMSFLQESLTK